MLTFKKFRVHWKNKNKYKTRNRPTDKLNV